jgi:predicted secreted protein
MKWILIVFLSQPSSYTDGGQISMQEFDTEYACSMAIDHVRAFRQQLSRNSKALAVCIQKDMPAPEGWTKERWAKERG